MSELEIESCGFKKTYDTEFMVYYVKNELRLITYKDNNLIIIYNTLLPDCQDTLFQGKLNSVEELTKLLTQIHEIN